MLSKYEEKYNQIHYHQTDIPSFNFLSETTNQESTTCQHEHSNY